MLMDEILKINKQVDYMLNFYLLHKNILTPESKGRLFRNMIDHRNRQAELIVEFCKENNFNTCV